MRLFCSSKANKQCDSLVEAVFTPKTSDLRANGFKMCASKRERKLLSNHYSSYQRLLPSLKTVRQKTSQNHVVRLDQRSRAVDGQREEHLEQSY